MARLARIVVPGLAHHVTQHGKATAGLPGAYTINGSTVTSPNRAPYTPSPPMYTMQARYLVDQGGEQVTEMSEGANEAWAHSNVWAGGKLVATYDYNNGNGGIHFELTDPLGTKRVQANASGQVDETCTGLPFGNDVGNPISVNCTMASKTANTLGTQDDATEHHFTGKERDAESGNDYFGARYFGSSMGRFLSPDPSQLYFDNPAYPQSLNLYSYGRNNPLINTDPTGLDCVYDDGGGNFHTTTGDCDNSTTALANAGHYLDCDGCSTNSTAGTLDPATGSMYLTDANGNGIAGTNISDWANPQGVSTNVNVSGGASGDVSMSGYGVGLLAYYPYANVNLPPAMIRDPNAPPPLPKLKGKDKALCLMPQ